MSEKELKENEVTNVDAIDENIKDDVFENNADKKSIKIPKFTKLKKFGLYAAVTVGVVSVGLIGYAAITLMKQESDIKKQIAMEQEAEKNAVPIPDDLKEEAQNIAQDNHTESEIYGYIIVKPNDVLNLEFDDGMSKGSVVTVSNNDNYESVIGKDKVYVLSEYKITNKLFSISELPGVFFCHANGEDIDDSKLMCRVIPEGDSNVESDIEWQDGLLGCDLSVGNVVQVLSYVDASKVPDKFRVEWYSPTGFGTYYLGVGMTEDELMNGVYDDASDSDAEELDSDEESNEKTTESDTEESTN